MKRGSYHRFQMRNIKIDCVANRRAEGLQHFGTFRVLRAVTLVKRDASESVVFLFNELLLQNRFSFFLFLKNCRLRPFPILGQLTHQNVCFLRDPPFPFVPTFTSVSFVAVLRMVANVNATDNLTD